VYLRPLIGRLSGVAAGLTARNRDNVSATP
jgi:hypothetical protein